MAVRRLATMAIKETGKPHYTVTFNGSVEIITTATSCGADVEAWIKETLDTHDDGHSELVVGFDAKWCEWRCFGTPALSVLQLCVGRRCLVFHIACADDIPKALENFFWENRFKFVGVGIEDATRSCLFDFQLAVSSRVDLPSLAVQRTGRPEMKKMGLQELVEEIMGIQVVRLRKVTRSNWQESRLSDDQVSHACVDAFLSYEIAMKLYEMPSTTMARGNGNGTPSH